MSKYYYSICVCLCIAMTSCKNNYTSDYTFSRQIPIDNSIDQHRRDSIRKLVEEATRKEVEEARLRFLNGEQEESIYANDGHPGTKPDDGLFGFDPWDDEDDAYNLERTIIDPYPNEW